MSEENKNIQQQEEESSSIDFGKILKDLKKHRKLYYKVLPIAFVIAVIYTLSLPNYYLCTVKLSPEMSGRRNSSMSQLAAAFGMTGSARMNFDEATEALFPTVYPELMNSVAFRTTLFPVKVHRVKSKKIMTYFDYLEQDQRAPWWTSIKSGVMNVIMYPFKALFGDDEKQVVDDDKVNPFRLTKKQMAIAKSIDKRIVCDVDKKSMIITINVIDQDPLIAATMADSAQVRLQDFIPPIVPRRPVMTTNSLRRFTKRRRNVMNMPVASMLTMLTPIAGHSWRPYAASSLTSTLSCRFRRRST